MVSIKAILAIATAVVSAVSASQAQDDGVYRKMRRHGNGIKGNVTLVAGTGTGTAISHIVQPTLYPLASSSLKYVTVTYTLGDGRAITRTITKTVEREYPVATEEAATTKAAVVNPKITDGNKTITSFVTVTSPHPYTDHETSSPIAVSTEAATIKSSTNESDSPIYYPATAPYGNFTIKTTTLDDGLTTTATFWTTKTTEVFLPSGTGYPTGY